MEKYNITILRPGGNDTALVEGLVSVGEKRKINDFIMKKFPTVEQVGFFDPKNKTLEMAGGEFCGNATRSFAFILLNNSLGKTQVTVSGTDDLLEVGIKKKGTAYAQMPIRKNLGSVEKITKNTTQVAMQGITHLIIEKDTELLSPQQIKELGKKYLKQYNLLSTTPSAGALFIQKNEGLITMKPVIWVRDIETLFYETSCASGSTAIALAESLQSDSLQTNLSVLQPSGMNLTITVSKKKKSFVSAFIDGPIELLKKEKITI